MLLSTTALLLGWLNCTLAWLPTLKLAQSMTARLLAWFTVISALPAGVVLVLMLALPRVTTPPWGSCFTAGTAGGACCA